MMKNEIIIQKSSAKNQGFTLVEVLISVVLLGFAILISSTLFDKAIRDTPKFEEISTNLAGTSSAMENGIIELKEFSDYYNLSDSEKKDVNIPEGYVEPISIKNQKIVIGKEEVTLVKGYYLSVKGQTINFNENAKADDDIFTFVAVGPSAPRTSSIEKMDITGERFVFFPLDAPTKKIVANYKIADKNKEKFHLARIRFYKSKPNYPYLEGNSTDLYEAVGEGEDIKDDMGQKSLKIPSYREDKITYLNSIDRSFGAGGQTLNKNGYLGGGTSTFVKVKKDGKNTGGNSVTSTHLIGLPYGTNNLKKFYDFSLFVSKSEDRDKEDYYVSLFDISDNSSKYKIVSKGPTIQNENTYKVTMPKNANNYSSYDCMDFIFNTSLGTENLISIKDGYLFEIFSESATGEKTYYPKADKGIGNTVFFDLATSLDSEVISMPVYSGYKDVLFLKVNPQSIFDKNSVSLLSYNWDYEKGEPHTSIDKTGETAFNLYIDEDGKLQLNTINFESKNPVKKKYELKKLLDLEKYKLDGTSFLNIAIEITPDAQNMNANMYVLLGTNDKTIVTKVEKISLPSMPIISSEKIKLLAIPEISKEGTYEEKIVKGEVTIVSQPTEKNLNSGSLSGNAAEISDILLYGGEDRNIMNEEQIATTLRYLYGKTLEEEEKEQFIQDFIKNTK